MHPPLPVRYAGFFKRLTAWSIDATLVQLLQIGVTVLLGSVAQAQAVDPNIQQLITMGWLEPGSTDSIASLLAANGASGSGGWIDPADILIWLMISAIYNIWFVAGKWQATPGKRWCRIKIVMANGAPLTLAQSAIRHAACGMSWLPFALGYFMAGFAREKMAMHDAILGSRVIYR